MEVFKDDECGYLRWTDEHKCDGFILNIPITARIATVLHRADCGYVTSRKRTHYTGPDFYKICSADRDELAIQGREQVGGWKECSPCARRSAKHSPKRFEQHVPVLQRSYLSVRCGGAPINLGYTH
jgi:hypothetical protein